MAYFNHFDVELFTQQYIDYTPYKLLDWIDPRKLNERALTSNARALQYLIKKSNVDIK